MAGEPIRNVKGEVSVPYRWSYGRALSGFFAETSRNHRIVGARCKRCKKVIIPPMGLCGRCFSDTEDEWVPVGDHGVLLTWTTVFLSWPGQPKEPPYTYGLVKLDGSHSNLPHLVDEIDPEKITPNLRVEAVWNPEPKGDLFDILYFRPESGR